MLKTRKRKAAAISTIASANHLTPEEKARLLEEKLRSLETADAEGDVVVDDDAEAPEEDVDYDYEDDEDEMGGDYAAEQYFDDGAADEDDDAGNDYD
jgi:DNA-directed RNA polymerase III subunit RPC7